MKACPPPYDTAQLKQLRVDKYSCIKVDTNWYSVPEGQVGSMLEVKVYPEKILIYSPDNQCIATHVRTHTRFEYFLQIDHYLQTLHTKPGALAGALTLRQADQGLRKIYQQHFENTPKAFVEMLLFLRKKQYTITQLEQAVEQCLKSCPHHEVNIDKLKILLQPRTPKQELQAPVEGELSKNIAQHCSEQLQAIQALIQ
jgi:hypothetical protein